jgi:tetratricopeptide (TPR) repeat protein
MITMKNILSLLVFLLLSIAVASAQIEPLTAEPHGGNKKASISEQIGVVKLEIKYNRPGVKGREGKIWGTSVAHYGFIDQGHGTSYAAPWRAGANENTTMSFSHPVKIEGKDLPAGTYGFFIALGEDESTIIFNKINISWGSFYYDEKEDALRVTVKNQPLDKSVEWLKYEFLDETPNSAVIAMSWEKRMIPFRVSIEREALQMAAFRNDFRTTRPYYDFMQAANWCVTNNVDLEQALAWIDRAAYFRVMGEKNFRVLSTRAVVLEKLNRKEEAEKTMEEALVLGSINDVHYYGRELLNANQVDKAFKVFKMNYDKSPKDFTTNVGMARAYSGKGDYKKAVTYMKAAVPVATDDRARHDAESLLKRLEEGQDINK